MNWQGLASAVVRRRVELGFETRREFIERTGIGARTVGDIEKARRDSYSPSTLARLEQVLCWPPGHIDTLLHAADDNPFSILGSVLRDVDGVPTIPPATDFPEGSRERIVLEAVERYRPPPQVKLVVSQPADDGNVISLGATTIPTADLMDRVARHIHRDDFVLAWLLAHAGLSELALWDLELYVRRRHEQHNVELLRDLEGRIREAGGEVSYPWDAAPSTDG